MTRNLCNGYALNQGLHPRAVFRARHGVALVITLILLAVITTLAIAFLALTHRETGAVDSMARTTEANAASDSGLERAKAQIVALFQTHNLVTNGIDVMGPDLMVSVCHDTNWLAPSGLFLDPSPPVFVDTNRGGSSGPAENRFYLDLNRNGYFEDTGYVPVTDDSLFAVSGVANWLVGDPQWIGQSQDPNRPHLPDNRFTSRYAFLIQPVGRTLDVNWIHNQAIEQLDMRPGLYNGFYRNQGVGPWELNLAGFLTDLNTNYWGKPSYAFDPFNTKVPSAIATGTAFDDAREALRYRYTPPNMPPLLSPQEYLDTFASLFPGTGPGSASDLFASDFIDGYANTFVTPFGTTPLVDDDDPNKPWPGADSKRHYFTLHDLWDQKKLPDAQGLRYKLQSASARGNTYDRYTYYRLLAQLGTDSVPEVEDRINLNYVTIPSWSNPKFRFGATNLVPWSRTDPTFVQLMGRPGPELFFLTVVTNLLAREPDFAFMVTNPPPGSRTTDLIRVPLRIPIYTNHSTLNTNGLLVGPLYAGRIHQILQLAANIHDATTGPKNGESVPYFPSVFRPQFEETEKGDVYITNYVLVTETATRFFGDDRTWVDLDSRSEFPGKLQANDGVYGIPLIIGARKGYPSFNEFILISSAEAVRRLEVRHPTAGAPSTNQTFTMRITNQVWFEARNSYQSNYARSLDLRFGLRTKSVATNSYTSYPWTNWVTGYLTSFAAQSWPGQRIGQDRAGYLASPLFQQAVLNVTNYSGVPDRGGVTNLWGLTVTNRMLFFLVDRDSDRIVDAVSLNGPRNYFDVAAELGTKLPWKNDVSVLGRVWSNARDTSSGTSLGVSSQITLSLDSSQTTIDEWTDFSDTTKSKQSAIAEFVDFIASNKVGTNQVPFTAGRRMVQTNYFRVNDPLVHYTMDDLIVSRGVATLIPKTYPTPYGLGARNPESIAWSNNGQVTSDPPGQGSLDPTMLDPGVVNSDAWEFPTNAFPNIGWLGRVHRGTPWQTIYLKNKAATSGPWRAHSGPSRVQAAADLMHPTKDWRLLDIFTSAPHPNATRGRLSVNQTNLAAWSAVLGGVVVSAATNDAGVGAVLAIPDVVKPAALADPIVQIVNGVDGINDTRAKLPGGQFHRLSDFMAVPALTFKSPFLRNGVFEPEAPTGQEQIFDSDYERIPQQVLSLVHLGEPRFVVYAWGQSLKPARRNPEGTGPSIVVAGADKGLCRNYQITGEMATRTVMRVEFDKDLLTGEFDYWKPHLVVESFNILPIE